MRDRRCLLRAAGLILAFFMLLRPMSAHAEPPRPATRATEFARDIQPIFQKHCLSCHGPEKQRSGVRLDRRDAALKGGDSGAIIVPGRSAASVLIQRVTSAADGERMPPKGERLTLEQVARLKAWIDAGAVWPEATAAHDPSKEHWAFRPLVPRQAPQARGAVAAVRNPIDGFVSAKLSEKGLTLSGEADRRTLIRRLKFDLLGLPPTPAEVIEFIGDRDPLAYEKLVDRYLASPQYGERWARHWLDVVRFAESHGFEMNQMRPNAWPYRDYVILSFNEDKPYDRFVREQLAGDVLGADEATGFLVGGPWDQVKSPDIGLTLQQRADELHDIVSTTGSTFLGLTIGCARCHNHKFDPITQSDYYGMSAVFAGVQHGERAVANPPKTARTGEIARLEHELAAIERQLASAEPLARPSGPPNRRVAVNPRFNSERFAPVQAKLVRLTILATNTAEPCIDELEIFTAGPNPRNVAAASAGAKARSSGDYPGSPDIHRLEFVNDGKYGNRRSWISNESGRGWVEIELNDLATIDHIVWARDREGQYTDRLAVRYRIEVAAIPGNWHVVATSDDRLPAGVAPAAEASGELTAYRRLVERQGILLRELTRAREAPMVYAGRFASPDATYRLHRGDPMQKREPVVPTALAEFGNKMVMATNSRETDRRLALGNWIADTKNPLTARVMVNRIWHYHFGQGIVSTPSDFGVNGGRPSHPELLDWLANEFMGGGWRIKPIHRLIVLSAAYRQSGRATPAGLAADADARLLWRFPPRRLEAEPLRDAILFVTGKLDMRMGGPGFDLFEPNSNYVKVYNPKKDFGPAEWRRMVYQSKPRMQLEDTFGAFDCPDAGQIAPRRTSSTTPLQALNLLNSRFTLQQAGFLAERIQREVGSDIFMQVRLGFWLTLSREPNLPELQGAATLVREHGLPAFCRALLNANEFVFVN